MNLLKESLSWKERFQARKAFLMRYQNARFTLYSNSIELLISRRIRSISIIPSHISAVELANLASSKVHLLYAPYCLVLGLCVYLFPGSGILCDWLYLGLRFIRGSYLLGIAGGLTVLEIWRIVSPFVVYFGIFPIYLIQDSILSFKKKKFIFLLKEMHSIMWLCRGPTLN